MTSISDELKEEFTRLLDERDERHRQDIEALKEQYEEQIDGLRNEVEQSKDAVEAMGFSRSIGEDVDYLEKNSTHHHKSRSKTNTRNSGQDDDIAVVEGIEIPLLPHDTFSYLAFVKIWSKAMLMTMIVILVQMTSIVVLLVDVFSHGSDGNWINVPTGVSTATSTIQVMTLFIGVFSQTDFQDSLNTLLVGYHAIELRENFGVDITYRRWLFSLVMRIFVSIMGLVATFCLIVTGSEASELLLDFTAIEFVTNLDNIFFWLTAWGYVGCSAQSDASRLVNASTLHLVSVRPEEASVEEEFGGDANGDDDYGEIIMEDIYEEQLARPKKLPRRKLLAKRSSSSFGLTETGRNHRNQSEGPIIRHDKRQRTGFLMGNTVSKKSMNRRSSARMSMFIGDDPNRNQEELAAQWHFPRFLFLCFLYASLLAGWALIFYRQKTGYYLCQTVFVQFNDELGPELAFFTGLYNYRCPNNSTLCTRGTYIEEGRGKYTETAKFGFCPSTATWTFAYNDDPFSGSIDPCHDWKVKSLETNIQNEESFDLLSVSQGTWFSRNRIGTKVPMPPFTLQCYDCHTPLFCGGDERGSCVNNRCVCKPGWHGNRCEFIAPCDTIEVDPGHEPFAGTRAWSQKYKLLKVDSTDVEVYARPVYISSSENNADVILYSGRRWIIVNADNFRRQFGTSPDDLARFLEDEYHAMWTGGPTGFISAAVDSDSPKDSNSPIGIEWFQPIAPSSGGLRNSTSARQSSLQIADSNSPVDARFLCTTCTTDRTNPCSFGGICTDSGTCDCVTGSSGQLCQIPPVGNGRCDTFFNHPGFDFDGGDCCEDTCVSTEEHECGTGAVSNPQGINAISYIGFPDCKDFDTISGSQTLFAIKQRGFVKCGLVRSPSFINSIEKDMCMAIAAAVLGDRDAVKIVWTEFPNRFPALQDEKFDVLMRTDHTASRDIYEKTTGTNYAATPLAYLYTGLAVGGIPPYPTCAEREDYTSPECADLRICILTGTTWFPRFANSFSPSQIFQVSTYAEAVEGLEVGLCNSIAASNLDVELVAVQEAGFTGDRYETGKRLFDKIFLIWMTRSDDRVWSQFVSWVLQALVEAEESGVTRATAQRMGTTTVFGDSFENMFRNAVSANGNYGELWDKNIPFPREAFNLVNNGTTGLILHHQFGNFADEGPPPTQGGRLASIINRGSLLCGVTGEIGFSALNQTTLAWEGFEIDICRAVSSSLDVDLEVVPIASLESHFSALVSGAMDLTLGFTHTLEREVKHQLTGRSFDFSPTYFYDGLMFSGPLPFGRCADDLVFDGVCSALKICVPTGTSWLDVMRNKLFVPEEHIVVSDSPRDSMGRLAIGICNAIAGESALITEVSLQRSGLSIRPEDFHMGTNRYSKEPLGIMTRSGDSQFSAYIRWIIFALFFAEERSITQQMASSMFTTNLFGPDLREIWQKAVAAVGNYGEIWERNLKGIVVREGRNLLNSDANPGPQLFANPGTI